MHSDVQRNQSLARVKKNLSRTIFLVKKLLNKALSSRNVFSWYTRANKARLIKITTDKNNLILRPFPPRFLTNPLKLTIYPCNIVAMITEKL